MDPDKLDRISRRAYEMWEAEGRPHGRHHEHWIAAERELGHDAPETDERADAAEDPHPGMMGDGTEEQNLGQPGHPEARITEEEVQEAFASAAADKDEAADVPPAA